MSTYKRRKMNEKQTLNFIVFEMQIVLQSWSVPYIFGDITIIREGSETIKLKL